MITPKPVKVYQDSVIYLLIKVIGQSYHLIVLLAFIFILIGLLVRKRKIGIVLFIVGATIVALFLIWLILFAIENSI